jgi:hypothetical protein
LDSLEFGVLWIMKLLRLRLHDIHTTVMPRHLGWVITVTVTEGQSVLHESVGQQLQKTRQTARTEMRKKSASKTNNMPIRPISVFLPCFSGSLLFLGHQNDCIKQKPSLDLGRRYEIGHFQREYFQYICLCRLCGMISQTDSNQTKFSLQNPLFLKGFDPLQ